MRKVDCPPHPLDSFRKCYVRLSTLHGRNHRQLSHDSRILKSDHFAGTIRKRAYAMQLIYPVEIVVAGHAISQQTNGDIDTSGAC